MGAGQTTCSQISIKLCKIFYILKPKICGCLITIEVCKENLTYNFCIYLYKMLYICYNNAILL